MQRIWSFIQQIWTTVELRRKILFSIAIIVLFRVFAHLPLPGVDVAQIQSLFANNPLLGVLNIFSGGTLANFSVMAVGINPYITSSIIMQLATILIPSLKELQRESEAGRERVNQYTRFLALPVAVLQSVSVLVLLRGQGLLTHSDPMTIITMITTLVAGSMLLMWLGELISTYGLGNGISLILFAGIVGQLPLALSQLVSVTTREQYLQIAVFAALFFFVINVMVFVNEAIRKVYIQYARRTRGDYGTAVQASHLPIKLNVAGVLPIIFGVSILLVPPFVGRLLLSSPWTQFHAFGQNLSIWFAPTAIPYMVTYFIIVFLFSYFSALVFFNAEDISEELKKSGAFVPGVRPGKMTQAYLETVVVRVTFIGALFLSCIAVLPSIAQSFTNIQTLALGGTSTLIVVSVVLETAKQVESMLVSQHYEKYL